MPAERSWLHYLDRLSLSTKVGIFVTIWLAVYSLVTMLVFHSWGGDEGGAGEGPGSLTYARYKSSSGADGVGSGNLFDSIGEALSITGSGGSHAHLSETITSYDAFLQRMEWLSPDIRPDSFLVTNPFLSDMCVTRYGGLFNAAEVHTVRNYLPSSSAKLSKSVTGSAAVVIAFRNGKDTSEKSKQFLLRAIGSIFTNSGTELREVVVVVDEMDPHVARLQDWHEWNSKFLTKLFGSLTPKPDGFLIGSGSRRLMLRIVEWTSDYRPAFSHQLARGAQDRSVYEQGWTGLGGTAFSNEGNMYNLALEKLDAKIEYVAFVSARSMVSEGWLLPLLEASQKRPNAIVYPALDVIDPSDTRLSPGADAVAAFDWSFAARWEPLVGSRDNPNLSQAPGFRLGDSTADPSLSPSLPSSAFFAPRKLLKDLGGFHPSIKDPERRSSELAMRTWMCGGEVLRQPCSRVAVAFDNLWHSAAVIGVGVSTVDALTAAEHDGVSSTEPLLSEGEVDVDMQQVAEAWLPAKDREFSFRARFLDRVAYKVDIPWDARAYMGTRRHMLNAGEEQKCASFDWYKEFVYPRLKLEAEEVTGLFEEQVMNMESFTRHKLAPVLKSYKIEGSRSSSGSGNNANAASDVGGFRGTGPHETQGFAEFDDADRSGVSGDHGENRPLEVKHVAPKMPENKPADEGANPLGPHGEKFLQHHSHDLPNDNVGAIEGMDQGPQGPSQPHIPSRHVQRAEHDSKVAHRGNSPELNKFMELTRIVGYCKDFVAPGETESDCAQRKAEGKCTTDPSYTIFACPKTCGLCDRRGDLCADFYVKMCPQWSDAGRCNKTVDLDWMNGNCRYSCGYCVKDGEQETAQFQRRRGWAELPDLFNKPHVKQFNLDADVADPFTLQREFAAGRAPDLPTGGPPCAIAQPPPLHIKKIYAAKWWSKHPSMLDRLVLPDGKTIGTDPRDSTIDASYEDGGPPRVLCGIYTMRAATKKGGNAHATRNTWARKCTGFVAYSNHVDPSFPTVEIKHDGPEEYNNMWQKSREIWKFIYRNYRDEFDFFILGGDDMLYIMEILGEYLSSAEIRDRVHDENGVFLGRRFYPHNNMVFNSGGAGYMLDKKALTALYNQLDKRICYANQRTFAEDVNVARCLRMADVIPLDTRDEYKAERYHPFQPGMAANYQTPAGWTVKTDWFIKYNPELDRSTTGCCSSQSIAFHYVKANVMGYLYDYMYKCPLRTKRQN